MHAAGISDMVEGPSCVQQLVQCASVDSVVQIGFPADLSHTWQELNGSKIDVCGSYLLNHLLSESVSPSSKAQISPGESVEW